DSVATNQVDTVRLPLTKVQSEAINPPCTGEWYIEINSGMAAIVKECNGNTVVFSYEKYPQESHSFPLNSFVNIFEPRDIPQQQLQNVDCKKTYCRELFRVALRYSGATELDILTKSIEELIACSLADKYSPGLNAASYEVYNKFMINRRAAK
uniref:hypothetical protein n=2 Tax=Gammaproteobacteria TaxID=1236 RepID=UPI003F803821